MAQSYFVGNFVLPTTAAPVKVATGNAIKTMLQLATPSTAEVKLIQWGISFDGSAAATPIAVEVFGTTVAASGGTGVAPSAYGNVNGPPSLCVNGTAATCFSPSTEGTVANYRPLDLQLVPPSTLYTSQFPLGREPMIAVSQFIRIRVTAAVTVNCYCWLIWEE